MLTRCSDTESNNEAYQNGFDDGLDGENKNPYKRGSTEHGSYEHGFCDGIAARKNPTTSLSAN